MKAIQKMSKQRINEYENVAHSHTHAHTDGLHMQICLMVNSSWENFEIKIKSLIFIRMLFFCLIKKRNTLFVLFFFFYFYFSF